MSTGGNRNERYARVFATPAFPIPAPVLRSRPSVIEIINFAGGSRSNGVWLRLTSGLRRQRPVADRLRVSGVPRPESLVEHGRRVKATREESDV